MEATGGDDVAVYERDVSASSTVRFPARRPQSAELKMSSGSDENASSATKLWQVYLLGGVMVGRWAWARWKERSSRGLGGHA